MHFLFEECVDNLQCQKGPERIQCDSSFCSFVYSCILYLDMNIHLYIYIYVYVNTKSVRFVLMKTAVNGC